MRTLIEYSSKVTKVNQNYDSAFKFEVEIAIDMSDTMLTDEEYKKVTNAIKTIRRTLAPYRESAERKLRIAGLQEKAKK